MAQWNWVTFWTIAENMWTQLNNFNLEDTLQLSYRETTSRDILLKLNWRMIGFWTETGCHGRFLLDAIKDIQLELWDPLRILTSWPWWNFIVLVGFFMWQIKGLNSQFKGRVWEDTIVLLCTVCMTMMVLMVIFEKDKEQRPQGNIRPPGIVFWRHTSWCKMAMICSWLPMAWFWFMMTFLVIIWYCWTVSLSWNQCCQQNKWTRITSWDQSWRLAWKNDCSRKVRRIFVIRRDIPVLGRWHAPWVQSSQKSFPKEKTNSMGNHGPGSPWELLEVAEQFLWGEKMSSGLFWWKVWNFKLSISWGSCSSRSTSWSSFVISTNWSIIRLCTSRGIWCRGRTQHSEQARDSGSSGHFWEPLAPFSSRSDDTEEQQGWEGHQSSWWPCVDSQGVLHAINVSTGRS